MTNEIEIEMNRLATLKDDIAEKEAKEQNEAPCEVCGSKEFVQKFRNVVGKISGRMKGHYSLLGGSITGYIDGYTKTLPVLSCRKCENEREIATWDYVYGEDLFWDYMDEFYFKVSYDFSDEYSIDPFFLQRPVETRKYMLENPNYEFWHYNECPQWDTKIWAKAGFKIPKVKKRYLFWEREVYPKWSDLEK